MAVLRSIDWVAPLIDHERPASPFRTPEPGPRRRLRARDEITPDGGAVRGPSGGSGGADCMTYFVAEPLGT